MTNKYAGLNRFQIYLARHTAEQELARASRTSRNRARLEKEIAELCAALQLKDAEILSRWNRAGR